MLWVFCCVTTPVRRAGGELSWVVFVCKLLGIQCGRLGGAHLSHQKVDLCPFKCTVGVFDEGRPPGGCFAGRACSP